jgi:hypothetical protein
LSIVLTIDDCGMADWRRPDRRFTIPNRRFPIDNLQSTIQSPLADAILNPQLTIRESAICSRQSAMR